MFTDTIKQWEISWRNFDILSNVPKKFFGFGMVFNSSSPILFTAFNIFSFFLIIPPGRCHIFLYGLFNLLERRNFPSEITNKSTVEKGKNCLNSPYSDSGALLIFCFILNSLGMINF